MIKKSILLLTVLFTFSLFGLDWVRSYDEGIKKATEQKKPVLFLYFDHKQEASLKLSYVISKGQLDCIKDKFIFVEMNFTKKEISDKLKSYGINEVPIFVLQDFNPKRKLSIKMLFIQPHQIFNALFEIYSKLGNQFLNLGDISAAEGAFNLIADLPNELGKNVKTTMRKISKFKKINNIGTNEKAQEYFDKALISIKNGSFDKAYLYLEKVKEIAPKSKIAKKAKLEQEKISDKVDKSKFLKKKDTKGSK